MNSNLLISLSFKNVLRHAPRSLGTVIIMVVSIIALNVLLGYVDANLDLTRDAFMRWGARGHLTIERPESALADSVEGAGQKPLTPADQRGIENVLRGDGDVATFARVLRISGVVSNGRLSAIFGGIGQDVAAVKAIKGPAYEYDVVAGQPLWQSDPAHSMLLGQGLAGILGCKVPAVGFAPLRPGEKPASRPLNCPDGTVQLSTATQAGRMNALDFKVTGIMDWGLKEVNDRLVVLPLEQAQRLLATHDVSEYHVQLRGEDIDATQRRIVDKLKAAGIDVRVFKWSDRAAFYQQARAMLIAFFLFALIVVLAIGFMSLVNASYMNFIQRTRELATLRSMGFRKSFIYALAGLENVWLALASGLLGVAGAAVVVAAVKAAGMTWVPPGSSNALPVVVNWLPMAAVLTVGGMMLVAIVASVPPIRKVVKRPIRDALSH
jgi:putative ABC transport system permease protein